MVLNTILPSMVGSHIYRTSHSLLPIHFSPGSGDVLTWGWNEHGMCGTGNEENVLTPYMLQVPVDKRAETVLVGSGAGHTMLVVRDNQIFE